MFRHGGARQSPTCLSSRPKKKVKKKGCEAQRLAAFFYFFSTSWVAADFNIISGTRDPACAAEVDCIRSVKNAVAHMHGKRIIMSLGVNFVIVGCTIGPVAHLAAIDGNKLTDCAIIRRKICTYPDNGNRHIVLYGKSFTIRSEVGRKGDGFIGQVMPFT